MDEEQQDGTDERLNQIVFAAVDPESVFRRIAAKGLVETFRRRFGDYGLVDLLVAVDNQERFSSLIVLERNEVDNYMYQKFGTFDPDIMMKIQMTDAWDVFVHECIHASGLASANAIEEVVKGEGSSNPELTAGE
jgi:hypothetical protein